MLNSDMPTLSSLLTPRSLSEFFEFWPDKSSYFLVDGDPARLPKFLQAKELQNIEILARANTGGAWISNGAKCSYMMPIDTRAAAMAYKMGLTVYLDDVTSTASGVKKFAMQIEAELGLPANSIRATAWASPTENGAACHYDGADVISIQLRGTKTFELAPMKELANPIGRPYSPGATQVVDEIYPQMANGFPSWEDASFVSLEMAPGSVLIYPRGTWHRTHAHGDSLSLSFMLDPPSAVDCILRQVRDVMLQDPKWRKPLYGAWSRGAGSEAALGEIEALLAQIPDIARVIAPRDVTLAAMPEAQRLASIEGNSRFQRVPNTAISTGTLAGEQVKVGIVRRREGGNEKMQATLTVPHSGLDVLNWIVGQDAPFRADDLSARFPEIPFDGLKQLLEACANGGLLKMLWFPALQERTS
jgi:hypothetical protein